MIDYTQAGIIIAISITDHYHHLSLRTLRLPKRRTFLLFPVVDREAIYNIDDE
jgi:hypothetical protein